MRVAVLSGGRSSEHEVSLASGVAVGAGLRRAGHDVLDVRIGRDGVWSHGAAELALAPGRGLLGADVAFPVLHGAFGEDGTVQGLLECLDLPYVGAGVLASALCLDKVAFKEYMTSADVPQVAHVAVSEDRFARDPEAVLYELAELGLPVFVKPARTGSSVGISRVAAAPDLAEALRLAFAHDARVVVEAGIEGLELECSVIGNGRPIASDPGEIVVGDGHGFYDYEAKYAPGRMDLVVPAPADLDIRRRVKELAVEIYRRVGVSGLARVDFFVADREVLVNELNTMPGFTETSVFARLFGASGVPFDELVDRLVGYALDRHADERRHTL